MSFEYHINEETDEREDLPVCDYCDYTRLDNTIYDRKMFQFYVGHGKTIEVCEVCLWRFYKEHASDLGGKFIRSDERIFDEYLEEWFKYLPPIDKKEMLREMYSHVQRDYDLSEAQFAEDDTRFEEFVNDAYEREELK